MEQIGYSLVDAAGEEFAFWGDTAGQMMTPDVVTLPNGDRVHCPEIGPHGAWQFVPRMLQPGTPPSIVFDGDRVIVTREPPVPPLIPKSVIIDRLYEAGKLESARVALDAADLYTRERWNTRTAIYANDPTAVALLTSIGADPAVILAPA